MRRVSGCLNPEMLLPPLEKLERIVTILIAPNGFPGSDRR
jgi:hypothetical protein